MKKERIIHLLSIQSINFILIRPIKKKETHKKKQSLITKQ